MNRQWIATAFAVLGLLLSASLPGRAQKPDSKDYKEAVKQSDKAAAAFQEIMQAPDHAIPSDVLEKAQCVVVFPEVLKAGFIIGGEGGRGVASCRTASRWSAPAYFHLEGGSLGAQIGAQSTDVVLLVMNHEGMQKLLSDNFKLGADVSAAAGPVGRQASAATDLKLSSEILSYSRSKGLFAGIDLSGAAIHPEKNIMEAVYGPGTTAQAVLEGTTRTARADDAFPKTLLSFSPVKGTTEQGLTDRH